MAPEEETLSWLSIYGTYDGGGELMTEAWTKLKHVFAIRRTSTDHIPTAESTGRGNIELAK